MVGKEGEVPRQQHDARENDEDHLVAVGPPTSTAGRVVDSVGNSQETTESTGWKHSNHGKSKGQQKRVGDMPSRISGWQQRGKTPMILANVSKSEVLTVLTQGSYCQSFPF